MSIRRTLVLIARDLRLGPRSTIFLWAVAMPLLITLLMQVGFLTLFDAAPRLGIADLGQSEITTAARELDGIELTLAPGAAELRALVERHDVDAGLVLDAGFDAAVRTGERPPLELYVAGESLASTRVLLVVTVLDLLRGIEARAAPVEVVLSTAGGDGTDALPISQRLIPFIVMFVLLVAGIFAPAFMIVEEREHRTLHAVLVTPVRMSEVLLSKAVLAFVMAIAMSYLTLLLNGAMVGEVGALLATLAVGAVICVEIGLLYGTAAKDAKTLYTLFKSINIILLGPVVFYLFPDWPQWIAKLFPTYWFIDPLYQVSLKGASMADVWPDLLVALGIAIALLVPVAWLGRRLQTKLALA